MYFAKIELKDKFDIIEATGRDRKDDYGSFVERVNDYIGHVVRTEFRLEKLVEKIVDAADGGEYRMIRQDLEKERTNRHDALIRAGKALNDSDIRSKGSVLFDTDNKIYGDFVERQRWAEIANHLFVRLECKKFKNGGHAAVEELKDKGLSNNTVTPEYIQRIVRYMKIGYPRCARRLK